MSLFKKNLIGWSCRELQAETVGLRKLEFDWEMKIPSWREQLMLL
jgi:hypothetical protein